MQKEKHRLYLLLTTFCTMRARGAPRQCGIAHCTLAWASNMPCSLSKTRGIAPRCQSDCTLTLFSSNPVQTLALAEVVVPLGADNDRAARGWV